MSLYQNIVCFLVFMVFHKTAAQSTVLAFSQSQIEIVPKQVRNTKSGILFSKSYFRPTFRRLRNVTYLPGADTGVHFLHS